MSAEAEESLVFDDTPPFIPDSFASHNTAISNFSQVIFPDIPDFFPPDSDINVSFILNEAIEPTSRDWIGLFKVGWTTPRNYTTYVWSPLQKKADSLTRTRVVTFQAYQLPGEDSEFYQFCYVTNKGSVRGASTPFQFRVSNDNDSLVEEEDETGMVILKTKADAFEEKIKTLNAEKNVLEETITSLKNTNAKVELRDEQLQAELAELHALLTSEKEDNEVLKKSLKVKSEELERASEKATVAGDNADEIKSQLSQAESTIEQLTEKLLEPQDKIIQLEALLVEEKEKHAKELLERDERVVEADRQKLAITDKLMALSLMKEEFQKTTSSIKIEKEEALRSSIKLKEEADLKMQQLKDERDLFKAQFEQSTLECEVLTKKLASVESKINSVDSVAAAQWEDMARTNQDLTKRLNELNKKYEDEKNKCDEVSRSSLERVKATNASKKLLTEELKDVVTSRDALNEELKVVKQEKEKLSEEIKVLRPLKSQLETTEERLALSESRIDQRERIVEKERKNEKAKQREMLERIFTLQHQLKEADSAFARATEKSAEDQSFVSVVNSRTLETTQTSFGDVHPTREEDRKRSSSPSPQETIISNLKGQVDDLTTRLRMGADAYKEKFMECLNLERKVKKLKILYQQSRKDSSTTSSPVPPTSPTHGESGRQIEGWGSKFEKIFSSVMNPGVDHQALLEKMETLQETLETARAKHKRYKQLYKETRNQLTSVKAANSEEVSALKRAVLKAESKIVVISEENQMLKQQMQEFIERSDDLTLKTFMRRSGNSSQPASSSGLNSNDSRDSPNEEEMDFEDALEIHPYHPNAYSRPSLSRESSDVSDDEEIYAIGGDSVGFGKFNMCAERDQAQSSNQEGSSKQIPIPRKRGVISKQPIRSPPQLCDETYTSQLPQSSHAQSSGDTRKRSVPAHPRRSVPKTTSSNTGSKLK